MSGFELNKLAGAVLLAALIASLVMNIVDILYQPNLKPKQRGYEIAVISDPNDSNNQPPADEPLDIEALMKTANASNGAALIKKCISCHSFEQGGANKVGPNLWNIAGSNLGANANFKYSDALKSKGGTWTDENLFHFLHKPSKFIPGTKMSFAGISKPQDVADLIAYLKQNK